MLASAFRQLAPSRYREHHGLFFGELAPGQRFLHRPGVTLSQQDNTDETLDTCNGAQIHFDARYAATTSWRRPLMVSTLTVQRLVGMTSRTLGCRGRIRGFAEISLSAPVFGGDTLYAESEILACTPLDARMGLVQVAITGLKDRSPEGEALPALAPFARLVMEVEILTEQGWREITPEAAGSAIRDPRFASHREVAGGWMEQFGLFFEDAQVGESFVHAPRRTFHRGDVVQQARRAFDFSPVFHDPGMPGADAAGRLQVPETLLLGAVTALTTRTFGRVSANLGWTDIRLAPVFEGDTVEAESTVVARRESRSRPDEGVLTVDTFARNQHGEEVTRYRRNLLVYRRDGDAPYARAGY